jgi:small GTP-binding protein
MLCIGQERFRTITTSFYRGANGILLVFDCTNQASFENLSLWLTEISHNIKQKSVPIMLLANKIDLPDESKTDLEIARQFAKENRLLYCETSGTTGQGTDNCIAGLVNLMQRQEYARKPTQVQIEIAPAPVRRRRCII